VELLLKEALKLLAVDRAASRPVLNVNGKSRA
jgi:hypothetical protein